MASMNLHRVYIPTNARNNQYILAEFKPEDSFYRYFDDLESCYERVARQLFALCDEYELHNVHLIANDKLPVVRFHEEAYAMQTEKQILFFYNPRYHEAHKSYFDSTWKARKIRILFLATGEELRAQAANFHAKVRKVLTELKSVLPESNFNFRVRDHQHLTYDLFSKAKGNKESYGYKLRALYPRYQARNCQLPVEHSEMTYVTFSVPVTRAVKTEFNTNANDGNYSSFYNEVADKFQTACAGRQLNLYAMVADGKLPIIRSSKLDKSDTNRELQKLSFDTNSDEKQISIIFNEHKLTEMMHFVIVAKASDKHDMGYGKFMNNVESTIRDFTSHLPISPEKQDLNVRFYQHISYDF
ncbi:DUF3083 family protein [Pseudoalteromonas xiamenensis]|uniref:DUF3083 family protein n=1 Tax=Pseudoalteromonas xiamenensis TaxID=882626 RepID=UPI0027E51306|nr:DUF3083 family protein [Pseudoalteromonas xiamenensis]WMN59924.1 DUF3083 family protein [Pseudoalteromonas xiamenensis]